MKLRFATIADLDILTQWYKDLRTDEKMDNIITDEEIRNQMEYFLQGSTYKTYFLEVEGTAVGYGMLDITRNPRYLRHLFIQRDFRRKGYGKTLITLLMDLHAISEIDIEVMVWNQTALKFYNEMGFKNRYTGMRLSRN